MKNNLKQKSKQKVIAKDLRESIYSFICVSYTRKKNIMHTLHGKLIKVRKSSLLLRLNDEYNISIGYRTINKIEIL